MIFLPESCSNLYNYFSSFLSWYFLSMTDLKDLYTIAIEAGVKLFPPKAVLPVC